MHLVIILGCTLGGFLVGVFGMCLFSAKRTYDDAMDQEHRCGLCREGQREACRRCMAAESKWREALDSVSESSGGA